MTMTLYSHDCNSVEEIPFELEKLLPATHVPLHEKLTADVLIRLVKKQPQATLSQLILQAQLKLGVTLSATSMRRLLKRYGIPHRSNLVEADNMRMPLAAQPL
jgi:hypothetical protein